MHKITTINKAACGVIRDKMNAALAAAGVEGIRFEIGRMSFTDTDVKVTVNAIVEGAKNREDAQAERSLRLMADIDGLDVDKVGPNGERLVGFNSRARSMPYIFERNGERRKCPLATARKYFAKSPN